MSDSGSGCTLRTMRNSSGRVVLSGDVRFATGLYFLAANTGLAGFTAPGGNTMAGRDLFRLTFFKCRLSSPGSSLGSRSNGAILPGLPRGSKREDATSAFKVLKATDAPGAILATPAIFSQDNSQICAPTRSEGTFIKGERLYVGTEETGALRGEV
jgi:hypothetical protein